jgi:hypothetical protein
MRSVLDVTGRDGLGRRKPVVGTLADTQRCRRNGVMVRVLKAGTCLVSGRHPRGSQWAQECPQIRRQAAVEAFGAAQLENPRHGGGRRAGAGPQGLKKAALTSQDIGPWRLRRLVQYVVILLRGLAAW